MRLLLFTLSLSFLSGCSTYSKKQCQTFNWQERGYSDAIKGESKGGGLAHYNRTCTKEHGVAPDITAYEQGFKKGLEYFCTPERASSFGDEGGKYRGTCQGKNEDKFLVRYSAGFNQYLKRKVSELKIENENLEEKVEYLQDKIDNLESQNRSLSDENDELQSQLNRM